MSATTIAMLMISMALFVFGGCLSFLTANEEMLGYLILFIGGALFAGTNLLYHEKKL
jgi:hypothetical protein